MERDYLERVHVQFGATETDRALFQKIADLPSDERDEIMVGVNELAGRRGLTYGLLALYRQQINAGFVLGDPVQTTDKKEKLFYDETCNVEFRLLWNPDRELRKHHAILVERGVIAGNVDKTKLINKDAEGKACYLCGRNIALQNPKEVLYALRLAQDDYLVGANLAYIENNHFTVMSAEHRDQCYSRHILDVLCEFADRTDGHFRAVFNGLAGASIPRHEHFQVTTTGFPVEKIRITKHDVANEARQLRVSRPFYYTPLWVIEGDDSRKVCDAADRIISKWHELDKKHYTENVILAKAKGVYRLFVFLRQKGLLVGTGKFGGMAGFECGGIIVLSYVPAPKDTEHVNERETFDCATAATARRLLGDIAPLVPRAQFE